MAVTPLIMSTKRSRSRSPSPSPVTSKRPRLEELHDERTRLQNKIVAVQEQIATHPDAILALIKIDSIPPTVLARITRLTVEDTPTKRKIHLTMDTVPFVFVQKKSTWSSIMMNKVNYKRAGERHSIKDRVDPKKKKQKKMSDKVYDDTIEDNVDGFIEEPEDYGPYAQVMEELQKEIDIPVLDLEAAFVAHVVFYNEQKKKN